ncbi:hypothetical protein ACCC92_27510, partial [Mucilaginibacter sp. Mucisp84]|uniref:hypothetical protein n=1 Tax=Mucilaginibacter sp. Mucisp84 TaxID=3243058 RepID=UPI0039A57391
GGQFRPEWVVSLRRIGVVTFIRISTFRLQLSFSINEENIFFAAISGILQRFIAVVRVSSH